MVTTKQHLYRIEKILCALYDSGGELGRSQIAVAVFHRNWSAAALDTFLASPELLGLMTVSRGPMRHRQGKHAGKNKAGRLSTRYTLTGSGWALLASGLRHGVQPFKINSAEVQRQFQFLLADQDPWALEQMRLCARGRAADAADERKREEGIQARKAARARKVKFPSAPRHRSEAELAARRAFLERKTGKRFGEDGKLHAVAPSPMLPASPTVIPTRPDAVDQNWRQLTYPVTPTPPPAASDATTLVAKIARAGYRTNVAGQVLFDGGWLDAREWTRRMPGIVDSIAS